MSHRRTVAVYVVFVLAVAGAASIYQIHTNRRFDHADQRSCLNRRILVANQRVVLAILHRNISELVKRPGPSRAVYEKSLLQVHKAQVRLADTPRC